MYLLHEHHKKYNYFFRNIHKSIFLCIANDSWEKLFDIRCQCIKMNLYWYIKSLSRSSLQFTPFLQTRKYFPNNSSWITPNSCQMVRHSKDYSFGPLWQIQNQQFKTFRYFCIELISSSNSTNIYIFFCSIDTSDFSSNLLCKHR